MKVLMVKPGAAPEDAEIENTLEAMQAAVGGYIQAIYPMPDTTIALVCRAFPSTAVCGMRPVRSMMWWQGRSSFAVRHRTVSTSLT